MGVRNDVGLEMTNYVTLSLSDVTLSLSKGLCGGLKRFLDKLGMTVETRNDSGLRITNQVSGSLSKGHPGAHS